MKKGKKKIKKYLKKNITNMDYELEEIELNKSVFRKYPDLYDDKWPRNWDNRKPF